MLKPNRPTAVTQGLRYYYGRICLKHPDLEGKRFTSGRQCPLCGRESAKKWSATNRDKSRAKFKDWYLTRDKEKVNARSKEWREANKEKVNARRKEIYEQNKEKILARCKDYRNRNIVVIRAKQSEYQKANLAKFRINGMTRIAKKKNATPEWADKEKIKALYILADKMTIETGIAHDVDHIVPLNSKTVCGLHWEGNLQVITKKENSSKGNRYSHDTPCQLFTANKLT